jgi:MarR family transcriptional regulator, organic hydroperoxide resistance regulator
MVPVLSRSLDAASRTTVRLVTPRAADLALLLRLRELGTEIALVNRRIAAAVGIRETDLVVLDVVHRVGPISPTRLAARTGIHAATMTGVLTRLEGEGWVERLPAPGDRRGALIASRGPERLAAAYADVDARVLDVLSDLDEGEAATVREVLARLVASVRVTED